MYFFRTMRTERTTFQNNYITLAFLVYTFVRDVRRFLLPWFRLPGFLASGFGVPGSVFCSPCSVLPGLVRCPWSCCPSSGLPSVLAAFGCLPGCMASGCRLPSAGPQMIRRRSAGGPQVFRSSGLLSSVRRWSGCRDDLRSGSGSGGPSVRSAAAGGPVWLSPSLCPACMVCRWSLVASGGPRCRPWAFGPWLRFLALPGLVVALAGPGVRPSLCPASRCREAVKRCRVCCAVS